MQSVKYCKRFSLKNNFRKAFCTYASCRAFILCQTSYRALIPCRTLVTTCFIRWPDLWRSNLSSKLLLIKMRNWHRFVRSAHVDRRFFHNKTLVIAAISTDLTHFANNRFDRALTRSDNRWRITNRWKSERSFITNLIDLDAMNFAVSDAKAGHEIRIAPHFLFPLGNQMVRC